MDVLRPRTVWIGGRCYRKNPLADQEQRNFEEEDEEELFHENVGTTYMDEVCDISTNIEKTETGYTTSLDVPSVYFKYIIGKKGETKKRLENETRTQIRIPRPGQEGDIVILGHDRGGVSSAKNRVDVLVDSARQRQPFTHFLSMPINNSTIKRKFDDFKTDVLEECEGDRGLDDSLFQNPNKLHLTLGTLALMSDSEISKAAMVLEQCQGELIRPILKARPMTVRLAGLEYMNDDPGAVDVLYAEVRPLGDPDRLQHLVDCLADRFVSAGLSQREHDRVKLHVTVMNTIFRRDPSGTAPPPPPDGRRGATRERESFDAAHLLRVFDHFDFGECQIPRVHLSQRYSTGSDGYYSPAASESL